MTPRGRAIGQGSCRNHSSSISVSRAVSTSALVILRGSHPLAAPNWVLENSSRATSLAGWLRRGHRRTSPSFVLHDAVDGCVSAINGVQGGRGGLARLPLGFGKRRE